MDDVEYGGWILTKALRLSISWIYEKKKKAYITIDDFNKFLPLERINLRDIFQYFDVLYRVQLQQLNRQVHSLVEQLYPDKMEDNVLIVVVVVDDDDDVVEICVNRLNKNAHKYKYRLTARWI